MSASRGRKIGNLSLRVRLAASEGGKIAQIGSLARWKRIFPAILWWKGCQITRLELVRRG